jgi:hypothetical protein
MRNDFSAIQGFGTWGASCAVLLGGMIVGRWICEGLWYETKMIELRSEQCM